MSEEENLMIHRIHRHGAVLLLLAAIVHSPPALADPTPADKNVARVMTLHGRDKLKVGDAQTALKLFQAAHALMGSPVTGLDMAKAEAAVGLLIGARDTALDVTQIPGRQGEPKVVKDARSAAEQLAADLGSRIPTLAIYIKGLPSGVEARVRMDGSEVPVHTRVPSRATNPGEHTVEVSANGYVAVQRKVILKEGQLLSVDLTLLPATPAVRPSCLTEALMSPRPPAESLSPSAALVNRSSERGVPGWAWGVGAAGIAALGVGVAFAVDYAIVRSEAASFCPVNNVCNPLFGQAIADELHGRWNRDIGMAMGFGAVGLIGVATAVGGIVKARVNSPSAAGKSAQSGAVVVPGLSPNVAGLWLKEVF